MKNIIRSWKTSLIALIIIGGLGVTAYRDGINVQDAVLGLTAIGFLLAKDADKTNSVIITDAHSSENIS